MLRRIAWPLAGWASLCLAGAAFADIQTFWKTEVCPDFGGLKPPIAFLVLADDAVPRAVESQNSGGGIQGRLHLAHLEEGPAGQRTSASSPTSL